MTEDAVVGWHVQLNGHGFEQTQEDSEGQGSLTCCSPWGHKKSDVTVTEQLYIYIYIYRSVWASLVAQLVKNLPATWETWVQSLGWEDPLEKGKATYFDILAWRIPWTVSSIGSQRVRHN